MGRAQTDTAEIKKRCETKLRISFREAKEYNGWFQYDGVNICRVTVSRGRKEVPPGTYGSIAKQLLISKSQLDALIECPLTLEGYVDELRRQGRIS